MSKSALSAEFLGYSKPFLTKQSHRAYRFHQGVISQSFLYEMLHWYLCLSALCWNCQKVQQEPQPALKYFKSMWRMKDWSNIQQIAFRKYFVLAQTFWRRPCWKKSSGRFRELLDLENSMKNEKKNKFTLTFSLVRLIKNPIEGTKSENIPSTSHINLQHHRFGTWLQNSN